jgi:predicted nuclease of predicted toxin-antitoxin system
MKGLADENFPLDAVLELRRLGWEVVLARDWRPATGDADLAAKCRREGRILLTFDKDFGELWREDPADASNGVVLFRLPRLSAAEQVNRIVRVLTSRTDWSGSFWVVEAERIRARGTPP